MSLTSSVPKIKFTATGMVIPQELDILQSTLQDLRNSFGGGLNISLESPQGQLASSYTAIISDKNNDIATIVNQIDPRYADGRFQDAIGRIYFLTRKPATSTSVICTLTGDYGVTIPIGTKAQDLEKNTYVSLESGVIGISGSVDIQFSNMESGSIPCSPRSLCKIITSIAGWDSITNDLEGSLGSGIESRSQFEYRRVNSVSKNGNGSIQSIYAEVFNVDNVLDVYATENPTGNTVLSGSTEYPLEPHSIYVAVVGGDSNTIADAIWRKKSLGSSYNGDTEVMISDTNGYSYPYPSYIVKFQRPTPVGVLFSVEIASNPMLPSNLESLVKEAIKAKFYGTDGGQRERIGSNIMASNYYAAISSVSRYISIISVLIGIDTPTLNQILIGIDQSPELSESDIEITVS